MCRLVLLLSLIAVNLLTRTGSLAEPSSDEDDGDTEREDERTRILTGTEYPPYDGWYNNPSSPDWGAADTRLLRRVPSAYSDGVYEPAGTDRSNPVEISQRVFNGSTGLPSYRNRTALLVFFGQQVVEEILDAQRSGCPPEYFNLHIPKGHPEYDPEERGGREIPILRTRYDMRTGYSPNNPRQQLNEITPWLDGSLVYGPNKAWADALRSFEGGRLASANETDENEGNFPALNDIQLPMANPPPPREHVLKPIKRFFKLGNPRGNENPFLLSFGVLWFRYHNLKARQLQVLHADWTDEKLFNVARKWTIALYQKLVIYDWLPAWLDGGLEPYKAYDPTIQPNIAHVFQSAAMRFGHTLVPPGVWRRNSKCEFRQTSDVTGFSGHKAVRTCNTYWNPQESVRESDIDEILMGMSSQVTEREDMIITPDLRGSVFGPLEFSRRDLMAINIQRGRDHGLPDYNTVRRHFNLDPVTSWRDINPDLYDHDTQIFDRLSEVYGGNLNNLDLWPAGLLETRQSGPGPLFSTIIRDQFRRIRDGDRFWFENFKLNGLFTADEVNEIRNTSLRDVIVMVTSITTNDIQANPFFWLDGDPCPQPEQLQGDTLAGCTPVEKFDYFSGSEWSYIISFFILGLSFFLCVGALYLMKTFHQRSITNKRQTMNRDKQKPIAGNDNLMQAVEWMGQKEGERSVHLRLDTRANSIHILTTADHKTVRVIKFDSTVTPALHRQIAVAMSTGRRVRYVVVYVPREYDLIVKLRNTDVDNFLLTLRDFAKHCGYLIMVNEVTTVQQIKSTSHTKAARKDNLTKFFRAIFAHALHYEHGNYEEVKSRVAEEVLACELTREEFAESLSMKPNCSFIANMFTLLDTDNNGYVSFREFLDVFIVFYKGTAEEKMKLMFDMYDIDRSGQLSRDEMKNMLQSLIELSNDAVEDSDISQLVAMMFKESGFEQKESLNHDDFYYLLGRYEREINYASLNFQGIPEEAKPTTKRQNVPTRARNTIYKTYSHLPFRTVELGMQAKRLTASATEHDRRSRMTAHAPSAAVRCWRTVSYYLENYRYHIFWVVLYTLVTLGIFIERAYYYSVEREHSGLRRIAGYGVTVTRGAASGMMFTYSTLMLTMCRNLLTRLRETALNRYVPFDAAVDMHKYIACLALFFTLMHCIGHAINFYHVSAQTAPDLICLFRNYYHATDDLPKFHRWCWQTITGLTGVLLTILTFLMYTFAVQYARRYAFRAFWLTHNLYVVFFILSFLHGAGRLVQPPLFLYFFAGPAVVFVLDMLVSVSRKRIEIPVVKAELLPSDVIYLEFQKPDGFTYKSGQWLRIACLEQGASEYHPFSFASAPHEENLSVYIRCVGPWTMNLLGTYNPQKTADSTLPKLYIDGPFGEGHQEWYKYEVAILVGGGIGVTPFASIMKDLVHRSHTPGAIRCKKVYFLWVTRTQKQFEWMTDIISEVEQKDDEGIISVHIFITQMMEKFDLRTTMIHICECYFQKIAGRSLLTGLQSITHFGRPNFTTIFESVLTEHPTTSKVGVFSCGPPPMTASVDKACKKLNRKLTDIIFDCHSENF